MDHSAAREIRAGGSVAAPGTAEGRRFARYVPHALCAAVLAIWFAAKAALFEGLEYTSDLFSNLEMSRSVYQGRPLLWENGFGDHKALHNYYGDPLLYPLTGPFGAYGLFLASALLALLSAFAVFALARVAPQWKRGMYLALAAALLFGPVAFWLWDDPIYGWHAEMLYLPLSILLASALARGSRFALWLAVPIVLVREEGAIVAWAVYALHEWMQPAATVRRRLFRIARWTALWLAVFSAGMALQIAMQPAGSGPSRALATLPAVKIMLSNPELRRGFFHAVAGAAWLSLCAAIPLLALSWRALLAAAVALVPFVPPLVVASSSQLSALGVRDYGFSWGPRFVILWSVIACASLFAVASAERPPAIAPAARAALVTALAVASIAAQALALRRVRPYDASGRLAAFLPSRRASLTAGVLAPGEDALLRCLGREIPSSTPVSSGGSLFARFHRQDIVWPDRPGSAWAPPRLVACDVLLRMPYDYGCVALGRRLGAAGFQHWQAGGISVWSEGALVAAVQRCGARPSLLDTTGRK
jgi:hypothetical protein